MNQSADEVKQMAKEKKQDAVAIIGFSTRFPGAHDYREFWDVLRMGDSCSTDIPADRWDWKQYGQIEGKIKKAVVHKGYFLDDVSSFDYRFFSISRREADSMDPQQRMLLEESWACLEDAGIRPSDLAGKKVGVYVAGYNTDFRDLLERDQEPIVPHQLSGAGSFSLANRISFFYDFRGPSVGIDTACSGALAAIKYGVDAVLSGECEMAMVGASNVMLAPDNFVRATGMNMLSHTGSVKTFDRDADGYIRGEGTGVYLLKSLSGALADGDSIHGVIRGIAVNHCGRTPSYTYPSAEEQANVIREAIRNSGVSVDRIRYIEIHGSGTPKGDPIEFNGITDAFETLEAEQKIRPEQVNCGLGSVKTNIGHLENAAGMAALAKVLLAMKHGEIPRMLHFRNLNPLIRMEGTPFHLVTETEAWEAGNPRIAGISSWGLGGTNVHMVVEEMKEPERLRRKTGAWHLFVISARNREALRRRAENLRTWLVKHPEDPADLSYTLLFGREMMDQRMAFVASEPEEILRKLEKTEDQAETAAFTEIRRPDAEENTEEYRQYLEQVASAILNGADPRETGITVPGGRTVHLPAYSFEKTECWLPERGPVNGVSPLENAEETAEESTRQSDAAPIFYREIWEARNFPSEQTVPDGAVIALVPPAFREMIPSSVRGRKILLLETAEAYGKLSERHIRIRSDRSEDLELALKTFRKGNPEIAALIDYLPLDSAFAKDLYLTGVLIRVCAKLEIRPLRVLSVADFADRAERAYAESRIGYERSLSVVLRESSVRCLLLQRGNFSPAETVALSLREGLSGEKDSVLYEDSVRKKCVIKASEPGQTGGTPFRRDGVYLITGGCGGLGRMFAARLLREKNASLILTGRSDEASRREILEELKKNGGKVLYRQADVSDAGELCAVIRFAVDACGRLDGVLCMAGIESEQSILERSREDFDQTLAAKINPALSLRKALEEARATPEMIVYFSSSSSVLGDFGSCDYAIANRFLMAYAAQNRMPPREIAVCWPLWKNGGITMRNREAERLYLTASGQEYMTEAMGVPALERVLASDENDILIMAGDRARIDRMLGIGSENKETRRAENCLKPAPATWTVNVDGELPPERRLMESIKELSGEILQMDPKEFSADMNFADIGYESVTLGYLAEALSRKYGIDVGTDVFFGYPTFLKLSAYLTEKYADRLSTSCRSESEAPEEPRYEIGSRTDLCPGEIAIIGMSGQFPDAENVEELWKIIVGGKEAIAAVPEGRLISTDPDTSWTEDPARRMGMVAEPEQFDPLFFELSPGEAEEMDPRQRLLLEESWKALEDAGLGEADLNGAQIGVFVGAEDGDWRLSRGNGQKITSAHNGIMASRLAYLLNLNGPCMNINTACSSGLTAFHQACASLRNGDCDMALVAGVNLTLTRDNYDSMARMGMLSADGHNRTFDNAASGMIPSDAVAVLVLKKLTGVGTDRHRIYGIVDATGINNDGRTAGITAPSLVAQEKLYRRIYSENGPDPRKLSCIVTHGTGTRIGDPIEINGLKNAFSGSGMRPGSCALLSVKPYIGHTLAASGIVSVISLLLAMREGTLPGMTRLKQVNKQIRLENTPFRIERENRSWTEAEYGIRTGAVTSFGISGTNIHTVIHSVPTLPRSRPLSACLIVFSAKTAAALAQKLRDMLAWLDTQEEADLPSVSLTLLEGRYHFRFRFAAVVRNADELRAALANATPADFSEVDRDFFGSTSEQRRASELTAEAGREPKAETLRELARMYLAGYRIDGNCLLPSEDIHRISLPAYPFENRRCWPNEMASAALLTPVWENVAVTQSLPEVPTLVLCRDSSLAEKVGIVFGRGATVTEFEEPALSRQIRAAGSFGRAVWVESRDRDPLGAEGVLDAFRCAKALLDAPDAARELNLIALTFGGQATGNGEKVRPVSAGIAGFFGVLAKENPSWNVRVLDLEENGDGLTTGRVPECLSGETAAFRGGRWMVRSMRPFPREKGYRDALRHQGVYLVLGGAGDVGSLWSEYAVRTADARVIWAGRRAENGEIRRKAEMIEAWGSRPEYLQADVTDEASLTRLREQIARKYGKVDGVILSTVAEFDRGIRTMDEAEFGRIIGLKISGCVNAEKVFGPDHPDFLLNFSSSSAIDMPLGQAGYTAGCCFTDAFACRVSAEGMYDYHTVNWGFWGRVGAGRTMPDSIVARFENAGMRALEPEKAFLALDRLLRSGLIQAEYLNMAGNTAESGTPRSDKMNADSAQPRADRDSVDQRPVSASELVTKVLSRTLKLERDQIDPRERFEKYGIDSITVLQLIDAFRREIPSLESTVFYECGTVKELIDYIAANHAQELAVPQEKTDAETLPRESIVSTESAGDEPIAVIGMSGRFAGASNLDEYWEILKNGIDSVRDIPEDRWSLEGFYEPDMEKAIREKKSYCKSGGFLEDISSFDPKFFHISPREAWNTDPQERLLLEESYRALEDAAYPPDRIRAEGRSDTGVFVGITRTGFELYNPTLWEKGDSRILMTNFSEMANRISYTFDLKGPSMAIDTMCSSSLTALHEACKHLQHGECGMALVGTANIYTHPATYRLFCEKRMLSPTGRCHSFGSGADGFVPGEGAAALVLKPLSRAMEDGDHIYGLIRATGVNHDGRTNGFTVPNPSAQAAMIRETLNRGHINAREISYVEAHGTGTKLGDPIEISGLTKAYREDTADTQYCAIGSAKSNIGHCEAAAGLAGVIKVLLQMRHRMLVPSLHAEELNPLIRFAESPFRVQTNLKEWERPVIEKQGTTTEIPRMAAISAFGAGGSNAHAILEESPDNQ